MISLPPPTRYAPPVPTDTPPEPLRAVQTPPEPDSDLDLDMVELDDEVDFLQAAITILDTLPLTAQRRILVYLSDRYLLSSDPDLPPGPTAQPNPFN